MTYPLSIVLLLLILLSSNVHSLTNDNTWYGHTLSTSSTSVVQMYIDSETSGTERQVKISSSVIEDRNRALLDQNIAIYEKERRRNLSWWGSFMNFLHCPLHRHDENNNPHCHPPSNHGGGSHTSSTSTSATTTTTYGNDNNDGTSSTSSNDEGCGNDADCGCGDNVDCEEADSLSPTPYGYIAPTPSPTIDYSDIEDAISNDQDCWWCGRSSTNSSTADSGNGSNSGTYYGGAFFAVGGIAVAALVARRRRVENTDASDHLLNGAVNKRKKAFGNSFCRTSSRTSCNVVATDISNDLPGAIHIETVSDNKRKKFFGRFFGCGSNRKISTRIVPNDDQSSETVFEKL